MSVGTDTDTASSPAGRASRPSSTTSSSARPAAAGCRASPRRRRPPRRARPRSARSANSGSSQRSPTGATGARATRTRWPSPAADGRSVVVVCDGVASTANSHLASRAAADAALAVLEPMLCAPEWPDRKRDRGPHGRGLRGGPGRRDPCPGRRAGRKRRLSLDDHGRGRRHRRTRRRGQHRGQSGLLVELRREQQPRLLTVDDSWAQESIAEGVAPGSGLRAPGRAHDHPMDRWRRRLGRPDPDVPGGDGARAARPVQRRALELLRGRRAARATSCRGLRRRHRSSDRSTASPTPPSTPGATTTSQWPSPRSGGARSEPGPSRK